LQTAVQRLGRELARQPDRRQLVSCARSPRT